MASDEIWVLDFATTSRRWDDGLQVLVFKGRRNRQGEVPTAIRSHPFTKRLKGRVVSATGAYAGWEHHPAAKASSTHYGYPPAAAAAL